MTSSQLITHNHMQEFDLATFEMRLIQSKSLTLPLDESLEILHQLTEFDLGRFLLANGGINGYWTAYWLIHGPKKVLIHPLEYWLIHHAPSFVASRERFAIFQQQIQKYLNSQMVLASIPCGLMDDLLLLDTSDRTNVQFTGIDLDPTSLALAQSNALSLGKSAHCRWLQQDAWDLATTNEFDLITSNGLNFYEPNDHKIEALYFNFYQALRSNGILITSFLTPSPPAEDSPWTEVNDFDARKQKAIFSDILNAKWQATRSENLTRQQLHAVGFQHCEIFYDTHHIFPTIIAKK